jgi:hypothetical protein
MSKPAFKVGQVWYYPHTKTTHIVTCVRRLDGEIDDRVTMDPAVAAVQEAWRTAACFGGLQYIGEIPRQDPKIGDRYKDSLGKEWTVVAASGQCGATGDGVVIQSTVAVSKEFFNREFKKV